jgi:hypothetical protein
MAGASVIIIMIICKKHTHDERLDALVDQNSRILRPFQAEQGIEAHDESTYTVGISCVSVNATINVLQ